MPSKRKFYRIVVRVEVLSETSFDELPEMSLEQIAKEIEDGDWSGKVEELVREELDGPAAAKALQAQGSDPEFFFLDADGNDIDDVV